MGLEKYAKAFGYFYALIVLITVFWGGFKEKYGITEQNTIEGKNIFDSLSEIDMIKGINDLTAGVLQVTKLQSFFDILGGLALSAFGTLQLIGGIVTFPFQIFGIITGFYGGVIPDIFVRILGFLIVSSVSFLLLSAKLGTDIR